MDETAIASWCRHSADVGQGFSLLERTDLQGSYERAASQAPSRSCSFGHTSPVRAFVSPRMIPWS
jgi:hypothetical protein